VTTIISPFGDDVLDVIPQIKRFLVS